MDFAPHEFYVPWLNGRPIDAPGKVDMINWYSQADGYFLNATKQDNPNGILKFFRLQGRILYDDEFHSENTAAFDPHQTTGRVKRVIRAIDMMNKYKAACEDGADLSKSHILDFDTIWRDSDGNLLSQHSMHNLLQVEDEQNKRSPMDCPLKAFWKGQEAERAKNAPQSHYIDDRLQNHPLATDGSTIRTVPQYYVGHNFDIPLHFAFSLEPLPLARALDPMSVAFVPRNDSTLPTLQAQERPISPQPGPNHSSGVPAVPQTGLTGAELKGNGREECNWEPRDDESWTDDGVFISIFCRPEQLGSQPEVLGPGSAAPGPDAAKPIHESNSSPERQTDVFDSGYATMRLRPVVVGLVAAVEDDSGNDADGEISGGEPQSSQASSGRGRDEGHGLYSMLKFYEMLVDDVDREFEKKRIILAWLADQYDREREL